MFEVIANSLDFTVNLMAFTAAVVYGFKYFKAKKARLSLAQDGYVWVVIQVGHPVVAVFKEQFKTEPDYIIDPEIELGHLVISGTKDYQKIIKRFRDILKANQDKEIRVITSGPTALNALLGQAAGPQYDVVWYQWDLATKNYNPIPPYAGLL